jgi:predicted aspartyl protease
VDEALAHRGDLATEDVRACEADAMVDTGAIRSLIPPELIEQLGVEIRRRQPAQLADGNMHEVGVSGPVLFEVEGREALEEALVMGNEVLIGQTTLEAVDLSADCVGQQLVPGHPEGPVLKVKSVLS